jgi:hypothetical protein
MLAESNLAAKFTARARQGLFAEKASFFSITCHADCYVGKDWARAELCCPAAESDFHAVQFSLYRYILARRKLIVENSG